MKLKIFIGSSSEGLQIAYSIQNHLDNDTDVTVWTQDVFRPSDFILESIINQLKVADLGIFIFSPDDVTNMRGIELSAARDNVIFEFGLFVGYLGRGKTIIIAPKDDQLRIPSDLHGLNLLTYNSNRQDGNIEAALGPVANRIRTLLKNIEPKSDLVPPELKLPFLERRDLLTPNQRNLLKFIEENEPVSLNKISETFPSIATVELSFRLDHLRLQMFIISEMQKEKNNLSTFIYSISNPYKKIIKHRTTLSPTYHTNISNISAPIDLPVVLDDLSNSDSTGVQTTIDK